MGRVGRGGSVGCEEADIAGCSRGRVERLTKPQPVQGIPHCTAPEGLVPADGTDHVDMNEASLTCVWGGPRAEAKKQGHFLISPIIVAVAEGSHGNGESLPDWI